MNELKTALDETSEALKGMTAEDIDQIKETIEKSQEEFESGALGKSCPILQVTDLSLPYNHLFNAAAKKAMKIKLTNLVQTRVPSGQLTAVLEKVEFFSVVAVGERNIVKAAGKIANIVNEYALQGHVTGCLAPLSMISLYVEPFELSKYAVFCFVGMTQQGSNKLHEENPIERTQEGEVGKLEIR